MVSPHSSPLVVTGLAGGAAIAVFIMVGTDIMAPRAASLNYDEVKAFTSKYPSVNATIQIRCDYGCPQELPPQRYNTVEYFYFAKDRAKSALLLVSVPVDDDARPPIFRIICSIHLGDEIDKIEANGTIIDVASFLQDEHCPE